jgi:hypothetical protein
MNCAPFELNIILMDNDSLTPQIVLSKYTELGELTLQWSITIQYT